MISKWFEYKNRAIQLRQRGTSIRQIEKITGIPRSTLSGWLKNIKLTTKQKRELAQNALNSLTKAREKSLYWHHKQKENNLIEARKQAESILHKIDITNKNIMELALSILYLGEGGKSENTVLGSSDPLILRFFIKCLSILYGVEAGSLKCELHLRSDQNINVVKNYWSKELAIPKENIKTYKDKRTVKSKTYSTYNGVCIIRCGRIALQRRMLYLSQEYCKNIVAS